MGVLMPKPSRTPKGPIFFTICYLAIYFGLTPVGPEVRAQEETTPIFVEPGDINMPPLGTTIDPDPTRIEPIPPEALEYIIDRFLETDSSRGQVESIMATFGMNRSEAEGVLIEVLHYYSSPEFRAKTRDTAAWYENAEYIALNTERVTKFAAVAVSPFAIAAGLAKGVAGATILASSVTIAGGVLATVALVWKLQSEVLEAEGQSENNSSKLRLARNLQEGGELLGAGSSLMGMLSKNPQEIAKSPEKLRKFIAEVVNESKLVEKMGKVAQRAFVSTEELRGTWKFGWYKNFRNRNFTCSFSLSTDETEKGYYKIIDSCNDNEIYWRLAGRNLMFVAGDGEEVTSLLEKKHNDCWTGAYLGSSPPAPPDVKHYLERGKGC